MKNLRSLITVMLALSAIPSASWLEKASLMGQDWQWLSSGCDVSAYLTNAWRSTRITPYEKL